MAILQCLPGLILFSAPIVIGVWLGAKIRKRRLVGSTGVRATEHASELDAKTLSRLAAAAPHETLVKAMRCEHGANNFGWLIATDCGIWWFATNFVHSGEETEFSYNSSIDILKPTAISTDRRLVIDGALFAMRTEDAQEFAAILRRQRDALASEASKGAAPPPSSVADELAKFARMRDDGILTDEEFEAQKRQLLGS